jgi:predicted phosphodiesterase
VKLLAAGDVHGDRTHLRNVYAHACRVDAERVVLLGDVGLGWNLSQFKGTGGALECVIVHDLAKLTADTGIGALVLDGNHEQHDWLAEQVATRGLESDGTCLLAAGVSFVPRGAMLKLGGARVLFVGGAVSIDRKERTEGYDWFAAEALTPEQADLAISRGPADLVLCHDCPRETGSWGLAQIAVAWGEQAAADSLYNHDQISRILASSGAARLVHGHLHRRYDEWVTSLGRSVLVSGLDCNGAYMDKSTLLIDTDEL